MFLTTPAYSSAQPGLEDPARESLSAVASSPTLGAAANTAGKKESLRSSSWPEDAGDKVGEESGGNNNNRNHRHDIKHVAACGFTSNVSSNIH